MPNLQSQATLFQQGNYHYTGYMGTIPQTVVFSRAVNMASITYPVTSITFDDAYTGAGAFTDVREGMTVYVYDGNTSNVKGRLRVAAGGSSSTVLQVNEFSQGYLYLEDNDRFDVIDEHRIWDKLVEASTDLDKDSRIAFSSQTDNYPPVANGGGAWFGHVDDGETFATVPFDFTDSWAVDPDNGSGLTYSTAVDDGTITVGTSASSALTATFPVGFRHVITTVTDADNSATSTIEIPVRVYDRSSNKPLQVAMDSLSYNENGWSATFSLPSSSESSLSTLPDGALVCYWEDETYNGTSGSYGSDAPANRNHIKFVGYLVRDSISISPDDNEVTFEAVSPLSILEQTGALPQLLIRNASPSTWQEAKGLTVQIALDYLYRYGAASQFDFVWVDGSEFDYARLAIEDSSSVLGQLRDAANSINVNVTCDRLGRIYLIRDPNYMTASERNSRTTAYAFTTADIMTLQIDREHRRQFKTVRGEGVTASTTIAGSLAVFSNSPGSAPATGAGSESLSRQIVTNQAELNRRSGNHYAKVNGIYWNESDNTMSLVPRGTRIQLPDGYDVFDPAYLDYITITLASSTNKRGVSYSASNRWLINSMSIRYDADTGTKDVSGIVSHETHAPAGTIYVPPQESDFDFPDFETDFDFGSFDFGDFGDFGLPAGDDLYGLEQGVVTLIAWNADGYLYEFGQWNNPAVSGGPVVTRQSFSGGINGTLLDVVVDAFSTKYLGTGNVVSGWLVTTTNIYSWDYDTSTNVLTISSSLHTFANTSSFRMIQTERSVQNFVCVATYSGNGGFGTKLAYSTDGASFTERDITAFTRTAGGTQRPWIHVSPHEAGAVYLGAFSADNVGVIYKIGSYGVGSLIAQSQDTGVAQGGYVHYPYAGGDAIVYWNKRAFDDNDFMNNSGSISLPGLEVSESAGPRSPRCLHTMDTNMKVIGALLDVEVDVGTYFYFSTGGSGSFALIEEDVPYLSLHVASPSLAYLWGTNSIGIYNGSTIESKLGNIPDDYGSVGQFLNIMGTG